MFTYKSDLIQDLDDVPFTKFRAEINTSGTPSNMIMRKLRVRMNAGITAKKRGYVGAAVHLFMEQRLAVFCSRVRAMFHENCDMVIVDDAGEKLGDCVQYPERGGWVFIPAPSLNRPHGVVASSATDCIPDDVFNVADEMLTPAEFAKKHARPAWPRHPDGTPKRMGEMTRAEQATQVRAAADIIQKDLNTPAAKEILRAFVET